MTFTLDILGYCGGFPVKGAAASSYLIRTDQANILMDCGSGSTLKLSQIQDLHEIDAVILSHLHNDHMADLMTLNHGLSVGQRRGLIETPIPVYSPQAPKEIFASLQSRHLDHKLLQAGQEVNLAGLTLSSYPVRHTVPCSAIKLTYQGKTLVYSGDSEYFPELADFVQGADIFICEATVYEAGNHTSGLGHMDGLEAGKLAQAGQVGQLILTHLPSDGYHQEIRAQAQSQFEGPVSLASEKSHWVLL